MDIEQRVKEIAAELFCREVALISNESTLESLGADDLDRFDFALQLEDCFDISIEDDAVLQIDTIQGYIDLVTNLSEPPH